MNNNDLPKKLPLWKDILKDDNIKTISDEELASRVKKLMKKLKNYLLK
jgi:hypothetical protein